MLIDTKKNSLILSFLITTALSAATAFASTSDDDVDETTLTISSGLLPKMDNLANVDEEGETEQVLKYTDKSHAATLAEDESGELLVDDYGAYIALNNEVVLEAANKADMFLTQLQKKADELDLARQELQNASLTLSQTEDITRQLRQSLLAEQEKTRALTEQLEALTIQYHALQTASSTPAHAELFANITTIKGDSEKYKGMPTQLVSDFESSITYFELEIQKAKDKADNPPDDSEDESQKTKTVEDYLEFIRTTKSLNMAQKNAIRKQGLTTAEEFKAYFDTNGITFG